MTDTATLERDASQATDTHLLVHLECQACADDLGLCGYRLSGPDEEDGAEDCIVCIEMADTQYPFCAKCGWDWRIDPR